MRSAAWMRAAAHHARCLVVFQPGFADDAEDFERNGFVAAVDERRLSVDMVAAQASLGYYARGTFPERLATDVVGPARARGYEQVWLVGMSMGGLGTVHYARAHTAEVTGILALAPYLGDRALTDEIRAQGGLARWPAPTRVMRYAPRSAILRRPRAIAAPHRPHAPPPSPAPRRCATCPRARLT